MLQVRAISREGRATGTLNDCMPPPALQVMIQSELHGDMQKPAEMTGSRRKPE